jgi:hypothetical protein
VVEVLGIVSWFGILEDRKLWRVVLEQRQNALRLALVRCSLVDSDSGELFVSAPILQMHFFDSRYFCVV